MKNTANHSDYVLVFVLSFITVSLELFLTRILYLKAWNHVVYLVIPFAVLGYGIGANFYLIFKKSIDSFNKNAVLGFLCLLIGALILYTTFTMVSLPVRVDDLLKMFSSIA